MTHSFSYKGSPYDNACIESFYAILKKEEVKTWTSNQQKERYSNISKAGITAKEFTVVLVIKYHKGWKISLL